MHRPSDQACQTDIQALLFIAAQFFWPRLFRLIFMPGGLAAAHLRWPESSLWLPRAQLRQLSWVFLPAALAARVASQLDLFDVG